MKPIFLAFALLAGSFAYSQTSPVGLLTNKFANHDDVHSFSARGFVARTVLRVAGERDFIKAVRNLKRIRVITVPRAAFADERVTVSGFQKAVVDNGFEEMAAINDRGDKVIVYFLKGNKKTSNRYFVLIDDEDQITGIELRGHIDNSILLMNSETQTAKQNETYPSR